MFLLPLNISCHYTFKYSLSEVSLCNNKHWMSLKQKMWQHTPRTKRERERGGILGCLMCVANRQSLRRRYWNVTSVLLQSQWLLLFWTLDTQATKNCYFMQALTVSRNLSELGQMFDHVQYSFHMKIILKLYETFTKPRCVEIPT